MIQAIPFSRGQEIEVDVEKLALGGKGISRVQGAVLFVDRAIPGQRVLARVLAVKKRFAEAVAVRVLRESPTAAEPFCPHFGPCGGCLWQNMAYPEQLAWKRRFVEESLRHLGGAEQVEVLDTIPSPDTTYYRNKMEFAFAGAGPSLALGLHGRDDPGRVLNLSTCFLQSKASVAVLKRTRELCRESGAGSFVPMTGAGYWRFLVLRESKATGQMLANLITAPRGPHAKVRDIAAALRRDFPALAVVHSTRRSPAQVANGEAILMAEGGRAVEERLGVLSYRVSANSFFQTNTGGAERLYSEVLSMTGLAEHPGQANVLDLYCGSGGITLFLARHAARVTGYETVRDAVLDAEENSRENGIGNCEFVAGPLEARLAEAVGGGPDVVVADPPRGGMSRQVVDLLGEIAPRRIVYVSCNPATQARDLALLLPRYAPVSARPVDMFPHTAHVECVLRLDRRE